jgi:regulation of enolase protein 1 (concanavalin A-like superfamily)
MHINEITNTLKTYTARVKLNNGSWVKTSVEAENSSQAMQLLKHLYISVSSVSELTEQQDELDEAIATKTPQQLQVKSLADQETKIKQQKKQLIARQALAKAQEKMRDANMGTAR